MMSFEIYPTGIVKELSNIMHITRIGDVNRNHHPGAWFLPGNLKIKVCTSDVENKGDSCITTRKELPTLVHTEVTISQLYRSDSTYLFEVSLNDTKIGSIENKNTESYSDVIIYTSNPWEKPSKARLRNFHFKNINEGKTYPIKYYCLNAY